MDWKKEIKAIIFDLDGVIVDTAKYHYQAWKTLAKNLGIEFTQEENENLKGMSRMDSLDHILALGNVTKSQEQKKKLAYSKNLQYLDLIKNLNRSELLPGTLEWLDQCEHHGIKIALGSASKNARRILQATDLIDRFEVIIDGTNTTKTKPDPQVFLMAAEALRLQPNECVVIEDSYKGIQAAASGGFFSIGIGDSDTLKQADINMHQLSESDMSILENLN